MSPGNWAARHAQNALGSLGALLRNPLATALTVFAIGIALALPAGLYALVDGSRGLAPELDAVRDFSVYTTPGLGADTATRLQREIQAQPGVAAVRLIDAEQALAELRDDQALAGLVAALDDNPLPHTLVVRPGPDLDATAIDRLAATVRGFADVDQVRLDGEWLRRLQAIVGLLARVAWLVGGLLVGVVIIIIGNTIRLDIHNRAAEIEVAKLLGASDAFVRRPFLWLGAWYGLFGALFALLVLLLGQWSLAGPVARLAGLYGSTFVLHGPDPSLAAGVVGGGLVVGWSGAWLAVARHLRAVEPN